MFNKGDKCVIVDSIMEHLIGKTVTIQGLKYKINDKNYYNTSIDDEKYETILICSERCLEKISSTNEQPVYSDKPLGWICPKCSRIISPYVTVCEYCKPLMQDSGDFRDNNEQFWEK